MASDVVRSNPFPKNNCQRPRCGICMSGDSKGSCWKSGVVYKIECNREPCIREEEKDTVPLQVSVYVGETCRTIHARGVEHQDLYSNKKESSFMYRHAIERHGGVIDNFVKDFSYKVIGNHRDNLNRILDEAVQIQNISSNISINSMNSRNEYFSAQYVRPSFSKGPGEW